MNSYSIPACSSHVQRRALRQLREDLTHLRDEIIAVGALVLRDVAPVPPPRRAPIYRTTDWRSAALPPRSGPTSMMGGAVDAAARAASASTTRAALIAGRWPVFGKTNVRRAPLIGFMIMLHARLLATLF